MEPGGNEPASQPVKLHGLMLEFHGCQSEIDVNTVDGSEIRRSPPGMVLKPS